MSSKDWLKSIKDAKKTAIIQNGCRKVHYLFETNKEMVEEYHVDTGVIIRRIWREKGKLGQDAGWIVEIGDPEPKFRGTVDINGIQESVTAPSISRRMTKSSLEWRIRNLSYPKDVYSVTAEEDETITVRTSNKKYFKKIVVPDLQRIGLKPKQENISFSHRFDTLIISYKKPALLLEVEKEILDQVIQLKTRNEDVQCPTS
ncbi:protein DPCD [Leptopilina heterotoma]|uniref:protein DPCD n=1 Tax=Leptopilina heterotoma TaxID=63436 RepID=UPI001CA9A7B6|nr:protein DPCD [Leptopilina heterotoma]